MYVFSNQKLNYDFIFVTLCRNNTPIFFGTYTFVRLQIMNRCDIVMPQLGAQDTDNYLWRGEAL